MTTTWTPAFIAEFVEGLKAGASSNALASKYRVGHRAAYQVALEHGFIRPSPWTPEREERLRELWAKGVSASKVAAELGGGLTRNAVIGKVNRLKLPMRKPSGPTGARAKRVYAPPAPKPPPIPALDLFNAAIPEDQKRRLWDGDYLSDPDKLFSGCRWIVGDTQSADWFYCGGTQKEGSSYCPVHHQHGVKQECQTNRPFVITKARREHHLRLKARRRGANIGGRPNLSTSRKSSSPITVSATTG